MQRRILIGAGFVGVVLVLILGAARSEKTAIAQGQKPVLPVFQVDARFPTMPDHTVLGGVGGVAADSRGNVWVFHRPHTLEEGNAFENGYKPAPPVLEFDETGKYIQGWGGPSATGEYQWTNRGGLHSAYAECTSCSQERRTNGDGRPGSGEHGIYVDHKDNVWVTGNGDGDGQILKFTKQGRFLLQIGRAGTKADSNDTKNVSRATTVGTDESWSSTPTLGHTSVIGARMATSPTITRPECACSQGLGLSSSTRRMALPFPMTVWCTSPTGPTTGSRRSGSTARS